MNLRKWAIVGIVLCSVGCSSQQLDLAKSQEMGDYAKAMRSLDPQVGEDFLARHPDHHFSAYLREHIEQLRTQDNEDLAFGYAKNTGVLSVAEDFLRLHPNYPDIDVVRKHAEELRARDKDRPLYLPYEQQKTLEAYQEFIRKYPQNFYVAEAQAAVQRLQDDQDFAPYRQGDTIALYKEFLAKYPANSNQSTAEARIADLIPRPSEMVITTGSIATPNEILGEIVVDEISMIWDYESAIRSGNDLIRQRATQRYGKRAHAVMNVNYRVQGSRFYASGIVIRFLPQ